MHGAIARTTRAGAYDQPSRAGGAARGALIIDTPGLRELAGGRDDAWARLRGHRGPRPPLAGSATWPYERRLRCGGPGRRPLDPPLRNFQNCSATAHRSAGGSLARAERTGSRSARPAHRAQAEGGIEQPAPGTPGLDRQQFDLEHQYGARAMSAPRLLAIGRSEARRAHVERPACAQGSVSLDHALTGSLRAAVCWCCRIPCRDQSSIVQRTVSSAWASGPFRS